MPAILPHWKHHRHRERGKDLNLDSVPRDEFERLQSDWQELQDKCADAEENLELARTSCLALNQQFRSECDAAAELQSALGVHEVQVSQLESRCDSVAEELAQAELTAQRQEVEQSTEVAVAQSSAAAAGEELDAARKEVQELSLRAAADEASASQRLSEALEDLQRARNAEQNVCAALAAQETRCNDLQRSLETAQASIDREVGAAMAKAAMSEDQALKRVRSELTDERTSAQLNATAAAEKLRIEELAVSRLQEEFGEERADAEALREQVSAVEAQCVSMQRSVRSEEEAVAAEMDVVGVLREECENARSTAEVPTSSSGPTHAAGNMVVEAMMKRELVALREEIEQERQRGHEADQAAEVVVATDRHALPAAAMAGEQDWEVTFHGLPDVNVTRPSPRGAAADASARLTVLALQAELDEEKRQCSEAVEVAQALEATAASSSTGAEEASPEAASVSEQRLEELGTATRELRIQLAASAEEREAANVRFASNVGRLEQEVQEEAAAAFELKASLQREESLSADLLALKQEVEERDTAVRELKIQLATSMREQQTCNAESEVRISTLEEQLHQEVAAAAQLQASSLATDASQLSKEEADLQSARLTSLECEVRTLQAELDAAREVENSSVAPPTARQVAVGADVVVVMTIDYEECSLPQGLKGNVEEVDEQGDVLVLWSDGRYDWVRQEFLDHIQVQGVAPPTPQAELTESSADHIRDLELAKQEAAKSAEAAHTQELAAVRRAEDAERQEEALRSKAEQAEAAAMASEKELEAVTREHMLEQSKAESAESCVEALQAQLARAVEETKDAEEVMRARLENVEEVAAKAEEQESGHDADSSTTEESSPSSTAELATLRRDKAVCEEELAKAIQAEDQAQQEAVSNLASEEVVSTELAREREGHEMAVSAAETAWATHSELRRELAAAEAAVEDSELRAQQLAEELSLIRSGPDPHRQEALISELQSELNQARGSSERLAEELEATRAAESREIEAYEAQATRSEELAQALQEKVVEEEAVVRGDVHDASERSGGSQCNQALIEELEQLKEELVEKDEYMVQLSAFLEGDGHDVDAIGETLKLRSECAELERELSRRSPLATTNSRPTACFGMETMRDGEDSGSGGQRRATLSFALEANPFDDSPDGSPIGGAVGGPQDAPTISVDPAPPVVPFAPPPRILGSSVAEQTARERSPARDSEDVRGGTSLDWSTDASGLTPSVFSPGADREHRRQLHVDIGVNTDSDGLCGEVVAPMPSQQPVPVVAAAEASAEAAEVAAKAAAQEVATLQAALRNEQASCEAAREEARGLRRVLREARGESGPSVGADIGQLRLALAEEAAKSRRLGEHALRAEESRRRLLQELVEDAELEDSLPELARCVGRAARAIASLSKEAQTPAAKAIAAAARAEASSSSFAKLPPPPNSKATASASAQQRPPANSSATVSKALPAMPTVLPAGTPDAVTCAKVARPQRMPASLAPPPFAATASSPAASVGGEEDMDLT